MSAPQPPESALARIVAELRAARVARGLSLQELSRLLKIQEHYLADIEDGNFSFLSCAYVYAYIKEYAREMGVGDTARLQACRRELGVLVGVKETGITDYIQSLSPAGMFRNSSLYGFLQGLRKKSVVLVLTVLAAIFVLAAGAVSLSSGSGGGGLSSAVAPDSTDAMVVADSVASVSPVAEAAGGTRAE
ncbi:helix-turn-helix domain-containing protein [Chlorobium phaeovibrioides]|uniref:HTH cro/C1-type domain-containing protein n=1 Tax=Chlorobium phaeovibrioides TaxID=1094 RepID=A0ABW9UMV4_CHLPH|nr:helix-turn-helix transcriptional regulator [Chlorobium phaeovibrioides]MWV53567.1 hypothetical protein [Chlorobium phaeovibrioides]